MTTGNSKRMRDFASTAVADVFAAYPARLRKRLLFLRQLILDVAADTEGVGPLQETLKWGEPAYLTAASRSGSTIRIDRCKRAEQQYAVYFNCQTTLVDTFRTLFPDTFKFEGNRSIVLDEADSVPVAELKLCIAMALTYHRRKPATRSRAKPRKVTSR